MEGRTKVLISPFYKVGNQEILLKFERIRNSGLTISFSLERQLTLFFLNLTIINWEEGKGRKAESVNKLHPQISQEGVKRYYLS